jgi:hypothetical protein
MIEDNVNNSKWELFDRAPRASTERLKVDGGYLYFVSHQELRNSSMCFVPDVDLTRYQAHLRDAYNQGFKDGQAEKVQK